LVEATQELCAYVESGTSSHKTKIRSLSHLKKIANWADMIYGTNLALMPSAITLNVSLDSIFVISFVNSINLISSQAGWSLLNHAFLYETTFEITSKSLWNWANAYADLFNKLRREIDQMVAAFDREVENIVCVFTNQSSRFSKKPICCYFR
jgi:hypothetical protein